MTDADVDRVVLVGFMGAGKSAVADRLAARLDWTAVDTDRLIEAEVGRSIPTIFAKDGEAYFREVERRVVAEALGSRQVVVATGGGWAGRPDWLDDIPPRSLTVWLDVSTETALERVGPDPRDRPLLATEEGRREADRRHEGRRASYALADLRVDTNVPTVDDVSARILEVLAESS